MSNKLIELTNTLAKKLDIGNSDGLIETLKNTVFKNADQDQLMSLLIVANQYNLNPWTKEIYAFPDKNNGIVPIVGVDGWARIINSHPQFDGMDFEQGDEKCTCIIYRKDRTHPIKVTEWMSECYRNKIKTKQGYEIDTPWQSHPKRMLRHKAMIQCARLAFGFAGIYDQDEAERIVESNPSDVIIDMVPQQQQPKQLVKGTKAWDRAIQVLKETGSLDTVKEHVTILEEDEKELIAIANSTTNDVEDDAF
ncbi:phage recombination protein Bet [Orbaceae bacterium ac157xtp]